jgi:hypothetical protein
MCSTDAAREAGAGKLPSEEQLRADGLHAYATGVVAALGTKSAAPVVR